MHENALTWSVNDIRRAIALAGEVFGIDVPQEINTAKGATRSDRLNEADVDASVQSVSRKVGLHAQAIDTPSQDLIATIRRLKVALVKCETEPRFYLVVGCRRNKVSVIRPDGKRDVVGVQSLAEDIAGDDIEGATAEYDKLFDAVEVSPEQRPRLVSLLDDQLNRARRVSIGWALRPAPDGAVGRLGRFYALPGVFSAFVVAHLGQYLLWLASWTLIGLAVLQGTINNGWLIAWALALTATVFTRMMVTWTQGLLAIRAGVILKQKLLAGVLNTPISHAKREGIGSTLARVSESESVEELALNGGFLVVIAAIEMIVASAVLVIAAAPLLHMLALAAWLLGAGVLAGIFYVRYDKWTRYREQQTSRLSEQMLGQQTRLMQAKKSTLHDDEDAELSRYAMLSKRLDRSEINLHVWGHVWLWVAILALAPVFVVSETSIGLMALSVGGVLLINHAIQQALGGATALVSAVVVWGRIRDTLSFGGDPESAIEEHTAEDTKSPQILEAERLAHCYPGSEQKTLDHCDFMWKQGENLTITGASGGGKSTLLKILSGLESQHNGLVLLSGHDIAGLGATNWRGRVGLCAQFNENHVFSETLAFNVLMGRSWPASSKEIDLAEDVLTELGLGPLLKKMPDGLMEMVGEGGWRLSHGEKARVFVARAILQQPQMILLDESLASLDPHHARLVVDCTVRRVPSVLIARHV